MDFLNGYQLGGNYLLHLVLGDHIVWRENNSIWQQGESEGGVPDLAQPSILLEIQGLVTGDVHVSSCNSSGNCGTKLAQLSIGQMLFLTKIQTLV